MGARNTAYPPMKSRKVAADPRIFQGTITQPAIMAAIIHPRLMLMYLGNRTVRSLAALMELAVMFVPTWAIYQASAAKKAAARPEC